MISSDDTSESELTERAAYCNPPPSPTPYHHLAT